MGYLPARRLAGFSSLARLVDTLARRLQIQEELSEEILDTLEKALTPKGAACLLEASHQCMTCRGAGQPDARVTTLRYRGDLPEKPVPEARDGRPAARASLPGEAETMSRPDVRLITFDVGGTLIHPHPSVGAIYAEVLSRRGFPARAGRHGAGVRGGLGRGRAAGASKPGALQLVPGGGARLLAQASGRDGPAAGGRRASGRGRRGAFRAVRPPGDVAGLPRRPGRPLEPGVPGDPHGGSLQLGQQASRLASGAGDTPLFRPDPRFGSGRLREAGLPDLPPGGGAGGVAPAQVLHVGDRDLEDLEGARRSGCLAVKIERNGNGGEGLSAVLRRLEDGSGAERREDP